MQITASTFSDPAMRADLQAYYENKKAVLFETLKVREGLERPQDVKITGADGQTRTLSAIPISAEKMVGAMVDFDRWLDWQADSFGNRGVGPWSLEQAQKMVRSLEANGPDSASNVRMTFASKGTMLAYVNADGTLAISNGASGLILPIVEKANDLGLSGQARLDYLGREIKGALARDYPDVKVTSYNEATSPSKREFARMWSPGHDVDRHYEDAMRDALAHLDGAKAWHQSWQNNMNDIRSFLLGLQEAAPSS